MGWIDGITCAADGPVPMTATRFPARLACDGQSAVCQACPLNRDAPGIAGILPRLKRPVAWQTTFAFHSVLFLVPLSSVITVHNISLPDHVALSTF